MPIHNPKEHRRREDAACQAGMRDAAKLDTTWPLLWEAMGPIGRALATARDRDPELRDLRGALGPETTRRPPSDAAVQRLRATVAEQIGLSKDEAEEQHPASPWRHRLVAAVQDLSQDPDRALRSWLRDGAPMGIRRAIEPGHLFPPATVNSTVLPDDVFSTTYAGNHPQVL